ncbi:hypothetical protein WJX72_006571 [[Myrmecia] bisecta]|uniref:EF-hand domain-containing protein n=1 Tax=[Myrmecia] bisecta TaxID=41462 RepID=A0AAW1Q450_9CHLO
MDDDGQDFLQEILIAGALDRDGDDNDEAEQPRYSAPLLHATSEPSSRLESAARKVWGRGIAPKKSKRLSLEELNHRGEQQQAAAGSAVPSNAAGGPQNALPGPTAPNSPPRAPSPKAAAKLAPLSPLSATRGRLPPLAPLRVPEEKAAMSVGSPTTSLVSAKSGKSGTTSVSATSASATSVSHSGLSSGGFLPAAFSDFPRSSYYGRRMLPSLAATSEAPAQNLSATDALQLQAQNRLVTRGASLSALEAASLDADKAQGLGLAGSDDAQPLTVSLADIPDGKLGSVQSGHAAALPEMALPPVHKRRLSWRDVTDKVVEHGVAGDLHLASPLRDPLQSEQQPQQPGDPADKLERDSDMAFEVEEEEAAANQRWYRHPAFWWAAIHIIVTAALLIAGIILIRGDRTRKLIYFEAWRWCFFLAGFAPIYWISRLVVHVMQLVVESALFTTKQALYFMVGTRKPLALFIRTVLLIPLFVGCFSGRANDDAGVKTAYLNILKVLGCLVLFTFGNVLKTLAAKMLATHFHKQAHFEKMQDALKKEYFIMALSQTRSSARIDDLEDPDKPVHVDKDGKPRPSDVGKANAAISPRRSSITAMFTRHSKRAKGVTHVCSSPDIAGIGAAAESNPSNHGPKPALVHTNRAFEVSRADTRARLGERMGSPYTRAMRTDDKNRYDIDWDEVSITPSMISRRTGRTQQTKRTDADRRASASQANPLSPHAKGRMLKRMKGFKRMDKAEKEASLFTEMPKQTKNSGGGEVIARLHQVEKHMRKNKLKVTFADRLGEAKHAGGDQESEVSSKNEAKKLAFYLFWNIKPYFDRNYIMPEDLEHFLPPKKAQQAFEMLDIDGDGQVSLHDIRDAVIQIYQERKNLAFTLKDTKTVVGKLERIIGTVIHVLFIFFYLIIFSVDVSKVWLTISSVVVAFSFIFGASMAALYQSVVFLFVVHPFDVGDALLIDNVYSTVEEIALVSTVIKQWNGTRIWYPNSKLIAMPIINITRSDNKWESFMVYLDYNTPPPVFDMIKARVQEFLEGRPAEFSGAMSCFVVACSDPMKIQLGVYFEYQHPGVDLGRTGNARHAIFMCICGLLAEAGVSYTLPSFRDTHVATGVGAGGRQDANLVSGGGGVPQYGSGQPPSAQHGMVMQGQMVSRTGMPPLLQQQPVSQQGRGPASAARLPSQLTTDFKAAEAADLATKDKKV